MASKDSSKEVKEEEFLSGHPTLESYSKELFAQVVKATKQSNALPSAGDEYDYYTSFQGFQTFASRVGARINKTIGKILKFEQLSVTWPSCDRDAVATAEQIEEQFEALSEANDSLMERVSTLLDSASGIKQATLVPQSSGGTAEVASWNKKSSKGSYHQLYLRSNVVRPQNTFKDMIDNSNTEFIPKIRVKPNALKPLPEVFTELQNPVSLHNLIENAKKWSSSPDRLAHPYQYELEQYSPIPEQLKIEDPKEPENLSETPLVMVTTEDQLYELVEELRMVSEFAVDLEAHSYRSYQGFVCLMQVSTRSCDYIIDTILLRAEMDCLNDVFTDPRIVKVMHGADWDITWLQRDFGIYVVNLFDTGQASRVLGLPKYSLAFLLDYCCKVQADKQYQLADWRIRPLPDEMVKYAREDTHYLLYIYDRMRNELLRRGNKNNNLITTVLDRSRNLCLKMYAKPRVTEDDHMKLISKYKKQMNFQQVECIKLLLHWRDSLARSEDESPGYVLPNNMLHQIAEQLPREPSGIMACCTPVPTLLKQQINEVLRLVDMARSSSPPDAMATSSYGNGREKMKAVSFSLESIDGPVDDVEENSVDEIEPRGPPVAKAKQCSITAFQFPRSVPTTPRAITEKISDIRRAWDNLMGQFMTTEPISGEELVKRSVQYVVPSAKIKPPTVTQSEVTQEELEMPHNEAVKRTLSIREQSDLPSKKAKLQASPVHANQEPDTPSCSEEVSNFKPFDYSSKTFSDIKKETPSVQSIIPEHSAVKTGTSQRPRMKMKSSEKVQTIMKRKKSH